jgi:hypothetical protein
MNDLVQIGKRLVPLEEIALIENYTPDASKPLRTEKAFRSRVTMLDKTSVLSEDGIAAFIDTHGFRMITPDSLATNPHTTYWVEKFEPSEAFQPEKPFLTRLLWRGQNGMAHSKLMLAPPEAVLAIAVRGQQDAESSTQAEMPLKPKGRRTPARRKTGFAEGPA